MAVNEEKVRYIIEIDAKYADAARKSLSQLADEAGNKLPAKMKTASDASKSLGDQIAKAAQRALYTIPIWLALRTVVTGFFSTIQSGIKYLGDLDLAMRKARNVTQGVTDMAGFMAKLQREMISLMTDTGKSVTELEEIYHQFAETGMDGETALGGMQVATKLAIATFSDSTEVAQTMVDLYRILGDTITDATMPMEKMQSIAGTFIQLWETNTGTQKEYNDALQNFMGLAKNFKLTANDVMTLSVVMHDFGQRGSTAGTQLKRAFQEMGKGIENVEQLTGMKLRGEQFNWMDVFLNLLEKIDEEMRSMGTPQTLLSMFGERSQMGVGGLAGGLAKLREELEKIRNVPLEEKWAKVNEKFQTMNESVQTQEARMKVLKDEMVRGFISAIAGADSYLVALKRINDFIKNYLSPSVIALGETFNKFPKEGMIGAWAGFFANKFKGSTTFSSKSATDQNFRAVVSQIPIDTANKTIDYAERVRKIIDTVSKGTDYQLQQKELLKAYGADEVEVEKAKLKYLEDNVSKLKDTTQIAKQWLRVQKEINNEIINYSKTLQSSFKTSLSSLLKGETSSQEAFNQFSKAMSDQLVDAISEGLSSLFIGKTGMGASFGGIASGLKSFLSGNQFTMPIVNAFSHGALQSAPILQSAIIAGCATGASILGSSGMMNYYGYGMTPPGGGGSIGGLGGLFGGGAGGMTGTIGTLGMVAFSGYSAYQQGKSGNRMGAGMSGGISGGLLGAMIAPTVAGLLGIGAGAGGGALFGGMAGTAAGVGGGAAAGAAMGSVVPVIGTIIGAAVGATLGIMLSKKKQEPEVQIESRTEITQIPSKIDVTNKTLSVINRNLVALTQKLTFILPTSSYFSESRSLEDSFSRNARMGII